MHNQIDTLLWIMIALWIIAGVVYFSAKGTESISDINRKLQQTRNDNEIFKTVEEGQNDFA